MTFRERLKKDHENNVKCFGKKPTIIIYVWTALLVVMACVIAIMNLICSNDSLAIAFAFIASLIGIIGIIYIVIISRFERKEGNKE